MITTELRINDAEFEVTLGFFPEEREQKQTVKVDVLVQFSNLPKACVTDQLDDACCYADLVENIQKVCDACSYELIESLSYRIFQQLRSGIGSQDQIAVRVKKLKIPLKQIKNSASFCCQDQGMQVQW